MEALKENMQHISGIMQTAEHSQSIITIDQKEIISKSVATSLIRLENPRGNSLKKDNYVNMSMSSAQISDMDQPDYSELDNSIALKNDDNLPQSPKQKHGLNAGAL